MSEKYFTTPPAFLPGTSILVEWKVEKRQRTAGANGGQNDGQNLTGTTEKLLEIVHRI